MTEIELKPKCVFDCFAKVNAVPRPSKKEEQMISFLVDFGKQLGLETECDKVGNVIIRKPATPGMENRKILILQSHMDMVCEKNNNVEFDFATFLSGLSAVVYDAFVLMLTKKRLSHKGFTLDTLCNCLDKVQGNQKEALLHNGEGVLAAITTNINLKMENVEPETTEDISRTIQRMEELGFNQANCYLYMQGHSVFNLVNRIGRALLDESFEYQVLIPSFSIDDDYQELNCIKRDIAQVFVQSN